MTKDTTLLVASVRNEGPNILEWVAHHRLCGFDRIQVFQNDSSDTTVQTLRTLDRIGVIEFHQSRAGPAGTHQRRAYRRASRSEAFAQSDWCMVLDGDEFLNVKVGSGKVHELIQACPDDTDAILVNWRVFGSNGHQDLSGELVTERFSKAEPAATIVDGPMSPFKALARTAAFGRPGVHLPRDPKIDDPVFCNGSGLAEGAFPRKTWRSNDPLARRFAQVHHYMLRDVSSFLMKVARHRDMPGRDTGLTYWQKHDRNEEEDLSLASRAFELWSEMKKLNEMSDGRLLRLRQRAIQKWRGALNTLQEQDDIQALRESILTATTPPMSKPFKLPRPTASFSSVRAERLEAVRKTGTA